MSSPVSPVISIDPLGVYTEGAISIAFEVPLATIARARRDGRLRTARIGNRTLITGASLLKWLESSDPMSTKKAVPDVA